MPPRASVRLWLRELESRVVPTVYTVNALTDTNTGSGTSGDLRYCIAQANAAAGADSIVFDASTFAIPSTITLKSGSFSITEALAISGPAAKVTIDAAKADRHFLVLAPGGQAVTISGLKLLNGAAGTDDGGSIYLGNSLL